MNTPADKIQANIGQAVESLSSQNRDNCGDNSPLIDNRNEMNIQRKRQRVAENSPKALQLRSFQDMADNSHRRIQSEGAFGSSNFHPLQRQWDGEIDSKDHTRKWINKGDGDAPTGTYSQVAGIPNRWLNTETNSQFIYNENASTLEKSHDFVIDMSKSEEHCNKIADTIPFASTALSKPRRPRYVPVDLNTEPQIDTRVTELASTLFDSDALEYGDVKNVIFFTLGDLFTSWVRGNRPFEDGPLQVQIQNRVDTKLQELKLKYPALTLIDVIVIFAYSWRADRYMREEMATRKYSDFGKWSQFATQLSTSLRKLRRFTGDAVYRCGRRGHEAANIDQTPFHAYSFLSTTYDLDARESLEKDPKYVGGDTLKISGDMEGYHMEEFSNFAKEREVILLPGHLLKRNETPRDGRNIGVTSTPPANYKPRTGKEPDSVATYLEERRQESIPPPPIMK